MSEDVSRRRSRGDYNDFKTGEESSATEAGRSEDRSEQTPEILPESKRRRPSSQERAPGSGLPPTDQGATTPRPIPTSVSPSLSSSPSRGSIADGKEIRHDSQSSQRHYGQSGRDTRNFPHQSPSVATRRVSGSAQPETPSTNRSIEAALDRSNNDLARLPSLASIAHDLPSTSSGSQPAQPPKVLSSPISARSRGSISSRGSSSPHASSSSSSSSAGKRRYGSIAPETGALSRSASQVPE